MIHGDILCIIVPQTKLLQTVVMAVKRRLLIVKEKEISAHSNFPHRFVEIKT